MFKLPCSLSSVKEFSLIVLLAAIWGASFLFMRILVTAISPLVMTDLRILIAAIGVYGFFYFSRKITLNIYLHGKDMLWVGIFNTAIPFYLYGFAAKYLPVGYSAILNALTPLFTAILASIYLNSKLTISKIIGLILGFCGVLVLMLPKILQVHITGILPILAIFACIIATMCYAIGSTYTKIKLNNCSPESLTCYTQLFAGLIMLPLWIFTTPLQTITTLIFTPKLLFSLLALALICSGVALVIFFHLIKTAGTIKASSTTFLIPVFGILWAYIFLGEELPSTAYVGSILIIASTILVLRPQPQLKI